MYENMRRNLDSNQNHFEKDSLLKQITRVNKRGYLPDHVIGDPDRLQ